MTLVDTDVLVHHLRGHPKATRWLLEQRRGGVLSISVITVAELLAGMRSSERHAVQRLLGVFEAVPVTETIARRAGEFARSYRASHPGIGLPDHLVAATADVRGLDLATLNLRHFPMFPDLVAPFAS